jgi:hypothetical protein
VEEEYTQFRVEKKESLLGASLSSPSLSLPFLFYLHSWFLEERRAEGGTPPAMRERHHDSDPEVLRSGASLSVICVRNYEVLHLPYSWWYGRTSTQTPRSATKYDYIYHVLAER